MEPTTINQLSEQLLLTVKMAESTTDLVDQLAHVSMARLQKELCNDDEKKAFWINCYNAYFLILRKEKGLTKPAIFRDKVIRIADHPFSLDDIEHGILRKYRYKFSLGYLPNIFASSLIKKLAVQQIDYRIHFALNCGAKSCPPIAFYQPAQLHQQLETATISFLEGETDVLEEQKEVHVTRLFQWFLGDFGGRTGIAKILQEKLGISMTGYKLVYKEYSWDENLHNFV